MGVQPDRKQRTHVTTADTIPFPSPAKIRVRSNSAHYVYKGYLPCYDLGALFLPPQSPSTTKPFTGRRRISATGQVRSIPICTSDQQKGASGCRMGYRFPTSRILEQAFGLSTGRWRMNQRAILSPVAEEDGYGHPGTVSNRRRSYLSHLGSTQSQRLPSTGRTEVSRTVYTWFKEVISILLAGGRSGGFNSHGSVHFLPREGNR